ARRRGPRALGDLVADRGIFPFALEWLTSHADFTADAQHSSTDGHADAGKFRTPSPIIRQLIWPRAKETAMSDNRPYDVLLRGGHVIDPASNINGVMDVAVRDGKIAAVQKDILTTSAKETIDVRGRIVIPGMIDTHAHVYRYVSGRFGMDADLVGVQSGVTTVIDQGGPSCMTLPGFRHFVAEPAKTRVYAFLSSYLV